MRQIEDPSELPRYKLNPDGSISPFIPSPKEARIFTIAEEINTKMREVHRNVREVSKLRGANDKQIDCMAHLVLKCRADIFEALNNLAKGPAN